MPDDRKEIAIGLFSASKKYSMDSINPGLNHGIGLILIWASLEAFISHEFNLAGPSGRTAFCQHYEALFRKHIKVYENHLTTLYNHLQQKPLEDMAPNSNRPRLAISSINNLLEIIEVIHRIRSNFVHGGKDFRAPRNIDLLRSSHLYMLDFMSLIFNEKKWI